MPDRGNPWWTMSGEAASKRERQARAATTLIFFMVGWVYAAWATRIPAIKDELRLSDGELGLAILGLEAGAIVGLPTGGALVARAGSRQALRVGFAVYPLALVAVALAPALATLAAALAVMAAATSVVDVAMNAQGVELERRYERPILSGLHAGHPLGLVAGGLAGTAAAAARRIGARALRGGRGRRARHGARGHAVLVREPARDGQPAFVRPSGRLLLLGAGRVLRVPARRRRLQLERRPCAQRACRRRRAGRDRLHAVLAHARGRAPVR